MNREGFRNYFASWLQAYYTNICPDTDEQNMLIAGKMGRHILSTIIKDIDNGMFDELFSPVPDNTEIERLTAEVERLREALAFYADENNWTRDLGLSEIINDYQDNDEYCVGGSTARIALKGATETIAPVELGKEE